MTNLYRTLRVNLTARAQAEARLVLQDAGFSALAEDPCSIQPEDVCERLVELFGQAMDRVMVCQGFEYVDNDRAQAELAAALDSLSAARAVVRENLEARWAARAAMHLAR